MRLISNRALKEFTAKHRAAYVPLQAWRRLIEKEQFANFAASKSTFNSVDKVRNYFVFDIAGNRYRIIAAIHFNTQILYIRHVLTHAEYVKWRP